ncbi:MAG: histidinol-phosphatase [Chloroflexaceae bacterium]|nr:histidinol-phosphatase [Chloroflexaceae bacterium]
MKTDYQELLNVAHELAWQAGKITLRYFQTDITTDRKADASPVTIADRETESYLRAAITARYPDHALLGEEEGASGNSGAPWRWILDPIDGTKAFIHGMPIYGVMIGVEYEGEPVVGVVHMPALGEMVAAAREQGCWWNGRRCRVSQVASLDQGLLVATSATRYGAYGKQAAFERLVNAAGMFRTWGDCYGYLLVATGRAEVMIDPVMKIWDAAALLPILQEAGGTFTDWKGTPTISGGEGLGTNGLVADEVLSLLARK